MNSAFFDRIDEQPSFRQAGGRILRFETVGEFRSRTHVPAWKAAAERRRHELAILAHLLEKDERQ